MQGRILLQAGLVILCNLAEKSFFEVTSDLVCVVIHLIYGFRKVGKHRSFMAKVY
jgi:hypothetical protein